jgi:hypothetical protein
MYIEILRSITGIQVFPVISLMLFIGVFATVLICTIRADSRVLDRHAVLPLDDPGAPSNDALATAEGRRA